MKRPEPIELENNLGPDSVTGEINRVPWHAYDQDEMDLYLAEKDKEIAELKDKCNMHDFFWEGCGFKKRGFKNSIAVSEAFDKQEEEIRMRSRALWLARAMRAEAQWNRQLRDAGIAFAIGENKAWDFWNQKQKKWQRVERKCRAMADKYGEGK